MKKTSLPALGAVALLVAGLAPAAFDLVGMVPTALFSLLGLVLALAIIRSFVQRPLLLLASLLGLRRHRRRHVQRRESAIAARPVGKPPRAR